MTMPIPVSMPVSSCELKQAAWHHYQRAELARRGVPHFDLVYDSLV
jgi:hypothetical protein